MSEALQYRYGAARRHNKRSRASHQAQMGKRCNECSASHSTEWVRVIAELLCRTCLGEGGTWDKRHCPKCCGSGQVRGTYTPYITCLRCSGRRTILEWRECSRCEGTRDVETEECLCRACWRKRNGSNAEIQTLTRKLKLAEEDALRCKQDLHKHKRQVAEDVTGRQRAGYNEEAVRSGQIKIKIERLEIENARIAVSLHRYETERLKTMNILEQHFPELQEDYSQPFDWCIEHLLTTAAEGASLRTEAADLKDQLIKQKRARDEDRSRLTELLQVLQSIGDNRKDFWDRFDSSLETAKSLKKTLTELCDALRLTSPVCDENIGCTAVKIQKHILGLKAEVEALKQENSRLKYSGTTMLDPQGTRIQAAVELLKAERDRSGASMDLRHGLKILELGVGLKPIASESRSNIVSKLLNWMKMEANSLTAICEQLGLHVKKDETIINLIRSIEDETSETVRVLKTKLIWPGLKYEQSERLQNTVSRLATEVEQSRKGTKELKDPVQRGASASERREATSHMDRAMHQLNDTLADELNKVEVLKQEQQQLKEDKARLINTLTEGEKKVDVLQHKNRQLTAANDQLKRDTTGLRQTLAKAESVALKEREQLRQTLAKAESVALKEREQYNGLLALRIRQDTHNFQDLNDKGRPEVVIRRYQDICNSERLDATDKLEVRFGDVQCLEICCEVMTESWERAQMIFDDFIKKMLDVLQPDKPGSVGEGFKMEIRHELKGKKFDSFTQHIIDKVKEHVMMDGRPVFAGVVKRDCQRYLEACAEVAWMIVLTSPPMTLVTDISVKFDPKKHTLYSECKKGPTDVTKYFWPGLRFDTNELPEVKGTVVTEISSRGRK